MRRALAATLLLVFALVAPGPAAGAWDGRYSVYTRGSFSSQINDHTCVGASIQMMLNMIFNQSDQSATRQRRYWRYAQEHSRFPITNNGADPKGWALALRHWGAGYYTVGKASTMQAALRQAARRMLATGKPVGLLVFRGGHAWVMTGFEATADPAQTDDFKVTRVQAMGPLYPHGTINGKPYDPAPRTWLGLSAMREKFTRYHRPGHEPLNGRWITVIP